MAVNKKYSVGHHRRSDYDRFRRSHDDFHGVPAPRWECPDRMKSRKGSPGGKPSALVGIYVEWWEKNTGTGRWDPAGKDHVL
jgi:hypothetical protein